MQQAIREEALPLHRAEGPIKLHKRRIIFPIAPSVVTAMKGNFLERQVVDPSPKPAHHCPIKILVVLVIFIIDQIEIPSNQPRTRASLSDFSEFLQELNIRLGTLQTIHTSQPPGLPLCRAELDLKPCISLHFILARTS
jgi:hypothetical protein